MTENAPAESRDKVVDRRNPPMPLETVNAFLQLQKQELDIRSGELARGSKQDEYNFELAKKSIEASSSDIDAERNHEARMSKIDTTRWAGVLVLFIAVFGGLVAAGQVELAKSFGSYFAALSAGAFGGFHYGRSRGREEGASESD